jgi:2-oxoisovalerate dehydrogenase E1 component alpha subunit
MIRKVLQPIVLARGRGMSRKNIKNYYQYDFTNKLSFIEPIRNLPVFRVLDTEGNVINSEHDTCDRATVARMLDTMIIFRELDTVGLNLQRQNRITFYMPALYEEGISTAIAAAVKPNDPFVLQNREQGGLLWRGYTLRDLMHSMKGTNLDNTLGKALGFHYVHKERAVFPTSAPMGSKIGHAAGAGFVFRVEKQDRIAITFFGEGAASQGDFHAALNFASTLGSQTLFVCRNNGYAISTPLQDQYAGDGVAPRGLGYGMPALKVDCCDALAVFHAAKRARELIIADQGPVLLEVISYRGGDHSTSDSSALYRTKEVLGQLQPFLNAIGDPIVRLGLYMQKKGWLDDAKTYTKRLADQVSAECMKIANEVDHTPFPDRKHMFEDVYQTPSNNILEQSAELEAHLKKYAEMYPLHDYKD